MKKVGASYRINFNQYSDLRNIISLESYNENIKYNIIKELSNEIIKNNLIDITHRKDNYNEVEYRAEFNIISNKEINELLEFIRINKLDLQPEFYYTLLEKLTKFE